MSLSSGLKLVLKHSVVLLKFSTLIGLHFFNWVYLEIYFFEYFYKENFSECWAQLLRHIVLSARTDSAEISLSAVKNFQELLFGRQQQTNSDSSSIFQGGNKSPSTPGTGGIKSKQLQYSLLVYFFI